MYKAILMALVAGNYLFLLGIGIRVNEIDRFSKETYIELTAPTHPSSATNEKVDELYKIAVGVCQ